MNKNDLINQLDEKIKRYIPFVHLSDGLFKGGKPSNIKLEIYIARFPEV